MSALTKLYRGETRIEFIANRKWWYLASGILIVIFAFSFAFRGFNYGIDFTGGTRFQIPATSGKVTVSQVTQAFSNAGEPLQDPPEQVGSGASRQIVVTLPTVGPTKVGPLQAKVAQQLDVSQGTISYSSQSSSWGHNISVKAIEGLVIFLIAVTIYISLRYQWRMAVGGLIALLHDVILAAGVYSVVGFEVTPSTIVGLLTILGFSLYDTVVVYDKVAENARDILAGSRTTFSEAANSAVNQTLMRSINTSLIGLLPVAGLLFVGAGILGVGTIKDLALILFVGLASGAYSSLFLATPIVVDLTERDPQYRALARRVAAKRASEAKRAADSELAAATPGAAPTRAAAARRGGGPAPAPRVGSRPQRRRRR